MDAEYANRKIWISFCKRGRKGAWNAFFSTNAQLEFFKAYRIYSMRWAIEVCFSEMKGLLRQYIRKGTSLDDYDECYIKEVQYKINKSPDSACFQY